MNRNRFLQGLKSNIQLSEKERRRIIRRSLQKHSWKTKCTVAMEEFAELQQQISKQVRGYGDRIGLLEEMADAYICLNFLESIFDIKPEDLQKAIDVKLERERRLVRMIKNEFPEWIYSPVNDPMWNNLFERIEDALGFKLFIWQKTYIMGLGYRCSGQTTADVLRNLVGERTSESIYLERPKNRMEDFYQKELIEIKRKLDDKGIISRDIERKKR